MQNTLLGSVALAALMFATVGGAALGADTPTNILKESIEGAGRNVMRTADGGLVAAYSIVAGDRLDLVFSRSLDNGRSWNAVVLDGVNGRVRQTAVDSNFQGSYIAFTEKLDNIAVGRIAFSSAPFADDPMFVVSPPVTPEGVDPQDTFIQASRKGWGNLASENRETVVYGWQDKKSKSLYIGVSKDGRTFPVARKVVDDIFATSGPAVAIRGDFVIATYQTTNPAFVPSDVNGASDGQSGRSYPAWIESFDGGQTWSTPKPLFGLRSADFPLVKVERRAGEYEDLRLAGGTLQPNSPILNWATSRDDAEDESEDKTIPDVNRTQVGQISSSPNLSSAGGTTFVQTSMMGTNGDGRQGEVSIVSFRPIEADAKWTHVIANNTLSVLSDRQDSQSSKLDVVTSQFQYSALIDTPVRATTYKEYDSESGKVRLVVAVSTDTGKTFDKHLTLSTEELSKRGISSFSEEAVFAASQCLFEDRSGDVYVDILVSEGSSMQYARVPVGVNANKVRQEQNSLSQN